MPSPRRDLLLLAAKCFALSMAAPWKPMSAQTPQPMASPHAPNGNFPSGMDGPQVMKPDRQASAPLNQQQIAASVNELYKLAADLKGQVEHTNLGAVFPVNFIKTAQEIEKLAKHIKNMARG